MTLKYKKKVCLLTLRVDNNYGGSMQRYALVKVLEKMGVGVTHLFFRSEWIPLGLVGKTKLFLKELCKLIIRGKKNNLFPWKVENSAFESDRSHIKPFYDAYIKHSDLIYDRRSLDRFVRKNTFDAYIVGSDQVWRKQYTHRWGEDLFLLGFLPHDYSAKRIAYGVSFGLFESDYSFEDVKRLTELYRLLDFVSVREVSGLSILKSLGWTSPEASFVLDPTMLLSKDEYIQLIEHADTVPSKGNMFCYLLDLDDRLKETVQEVAEERQLCPFFASINHPFTMSPEQWLRSFWDSDFVLTNSYHGVVFSLIFNKPFMLLRNEKRGNARFESLQRVFAFGDCYEGADWTRINDEIDSQRKRSMSFLQEALFGASN